MFTKTAMALAIIVSTASGALAATKQTSTNPSWNVYNSRGERIGADPDAHVRFMLQHDQGRD
jgi:hypothetical protein